MRAVLQAEYVPTLYLICGLPGSGKTTLAKKIEVERKVLRLCPDEWMHSLSMDLHDDVKRAAVESLQWEFAERVLILGIDVVLEFGFWSRRDRDLYRSRAEALGARVALKFLNVSRDELSTRLNKRNASLQPATARIEESQLDRWWRQFEPPTPDELL